MGSWYDPIIDIGSNLLDYGSKAVDWVGKNKDWLGPIAKTGGAIWLMNRKQNSQDDYLDWMRDQEDRRYQQAMANYEASQEGEEEAEAEEEEESSEMKDLMAEYYDKAIEMLRPYYEAGYKVLPGMTRNYNQYSDVLEKLLARMATDENYNKIESAPASIFELPQRGRLK